MKKRLIAGGLLVFSLMLPAPPPAVAGEDLSIGRMRLMIWPEHDDSGVLVVYDGRFVEDAEFPAKTSFFIPKDVVINDMCSLSPTGQHFCQLYAVEKGQVEDTAHLSLPFANFYLSFHTPALDVDSAKRQFDFRLKANHAIRNLEIDIQQPLRSSEFNISPAGGEVIEKKGFNHFKYVLNDIARGDEKLIRINYIKKDREPSVDLKFASMSSPRVWGSPYEAQRKAKTLVYVIFAGGLAAAVSGLAWIVVARRRKKSSS